MSIVGPNRKISINRLITSGGKDGYTDPDIYTDVSAYIERIDPKLAAILDGGGVFATHQGFISENIDVIISDRVTDDRGKVYTIQGVIPYEDNYEAGSYSNHTELILVEDNGN